MSLRTLIFLAGLAGFAWAGAAATAEVIDDFETAQAELTDTGSSVVTDNGVDVILGDHRELEIERLDGTVGATAEVLDPGAGGLLRFAADAGVDTEAIATVVWDADTNTTVFDGDGLAGVDLTDNNESAFRIQVEQATDGAQLILEVFTNDGNSSKAGLRLPAVAATTDFFISYVDFVTNLGTGADFANVGAIVLRVLGINVSIDIGHLETVGPTLTVTKIDLDPADNMDYGTDPVMPGDTIRYQVQITNTGGLAEGVDLVDTPDANTTFTADSLTATPVALPDTFAALGNVTRIVANPGVLDNDQDPDGDVLFVRVSGSDTVTSAGGAVAWNDAGDDDQGEGGFEYFPPAGFRGVDRFEYQLEDADGDLATGQVMILLDRTIWFVDDDHVGANLGTLTDPFIDFTQLDDSANDVDRDGDIIFVYAHSGGNYLHAGLELEPGQSLIGEGEGLTVDGNIIVPAGATALIHADDPGVGVAHGALLTTNNTIRGVTFGDTEGFAISGAGAGTLTVSNTAVTGAGGIIDIDSTTLAVDFGAVSSNAGGGTAIDLTNVDGSFAADSTTINGCPGSINVANAAAASTFDFGPTVIGGGAGAGPVLASSGAATFTFDSLDVTTTGTALNVHTAGTVNIGDMGNSLEATAGAAIIAHSTTIGGPWWRFDSIRSSASPTHGIHLSSMTGSFLALETIIDEPTEHGILLQNNSGGIRDFVDTEISGAGVPMGTVGDGVRIEGFQTIRFFSGLAITTDNGAGVRDDGASLLLVEGTGNTIAAMGGPALHLAGTTVADTAATGPARFATLSSTDSPTFGVYIEANPLIPLAGGVVADSGSITGALGTAFNVGTAVDGSGGGGTVTYAGSITNSSGRSVSIQERTGGAVTLSGNIDDTGAGILVQNNNGVVNTITFSGSSKVLNTGANTAVLLDNNDDAVVSFTGGGLDIDTSGAVTAFHAINGGTVEVTGVGNSVSTTAGTGTAVHIEDTTIASTGVTFHDVSASSGTTPGLFLDDTGTGFFRVTGDGGGANNGSGGTIADRTVDAVTLNAVTNVSLNYMNLDDNDDNGVSGTTVNGFTMNRSNVRRNATPGDSTEAGLLFNNLTGTALGGSNPTEITNSVIFGGGEDNVRLRNTMGTLTRLHIVNSTIGNGATTNNDDGIDLETSGTAVANITVTGSNFIANRGDHFNTTALSGTSIDVVFTSNTLVGGHPSPLGQGVTLASGANATTTYDITGNSINGAVIQAINVNKGDLAAGTMSGTIHDNTIGTPGTAGSGSSTGIGIQVILNGAGTHTAAVTDNRIREWENGPGIRILARDGGASGGTLNVTVTGNVLSNPGMFGYSMLLQSGAAAGDAHTLCAIVGNTTVMALENTFIDNPGAFDGTVTLFQRFATTMILPGYSGGATSDPDLTAYFQALNNGVVTVQTGDAPYFTGGIATGIGGGAACPTP